MARSTRTVVLEIRKCLEQLYQGNILLGWRHEFDFNGNMEIEFGEFCKGIQSLREKAHFTVADVERDWKAVDTDEDGKISFREICPYFSALLEGFRSWLQAKFDDPVEMFIDMDKFRTGKIELNVFLSACENGGLVGRTFAVYQNHLELFDESVAPATFSFDVDNLSTLFRGLDFRGNGHLSIDEVVFLEPGYREREALKSGWGTKDAMERAIRDMESARSLVEVYDNRTPGRWSTIPLEPPSYLLTWRQKLDRERMQRKLCHDAADELKSFMCKRHGTLIRAWRRALNPGGKSSVSRQQVLHYCAVNDFPGDSKAAYSCLDRGNQGYLTIEDLDSHAADDLAFFRKQLITCFGGLEEARAALKTWASNYLKMGGLDEKHVAKKSRAGNKISWKAFESFLLQAMQLQDGDPRRHGFGFARVRSLFETLDRDGFTLMHLASDWKFLVQQELLPWAGTLPDEQAKRHFLEELLSSYGSYIAAWIHLLDRDNKNEVTWTEFTAACEEIGFVTNVAGCWRKLDDCCLGAITLLQIDRESHEILLSFRNWAHKTCGSVLAAYAVLDRDGDGAMTCQEFRKASKFFGWDGDAPSLFNALAPRNRGQRGSKKESALSSKDIEFLDTWAEDIQPDTIKSPRGQLQGSPSQVAVSGFGKEQKCASMPHMPYMALTEHTSAGYRGPEIWSNDLISSNCLVGRARRPLSASPPSHATRPANQARSRPSSAAAAFRGKVPPGKLTSIYGPAVFSARRNTSRPASPHSPQSPYVEQQAHIGRRPRGRRYGACNVCELASAGRVPPGITGTLALRNLRCRCPIQRRSMPTLL
eukprot:TRINITY_DN66376_c0_g1_i1.p1 TRINITY_DN66376_c0_g1~~TRINITY_DN66376_c0_g1_i1.p1  ORF type:complete len:827 (+),score=130.59 TRINITY_DN66376_c0_g1_i1:30-2483(+)